MQYISFFAKQKCLYMGWVTKLPGRAKARWNTKLFLCQTYRTNHNKFPIKPLRIEYIKLSKRNKIQTMLEC